MSLSKYNPGQELASIDFESMIGGPLISVVNAQAQASMSSVDFIQKVGFTEDKEPIYVSFKYPKQVAPYREGNEGQVIAVNVTAAGSGYTVAPTVAISGTGGAGSTGTAYLTPSGGIDRIEVDNPGSGYPSTGTTIAITPNAADTGVTTATATVAVGAEEAKAAQFQEMRIEVPILTMLPIPFIRIDETTVDFNAKINSVESRNVETEFGIKGDLTVKQRWPGGSAKLSVSASYKRKSQQGFNIEKTYSMAVHVRAVQDEMPAGMEKLLGILENAIVSTPTAIPAA
ncbi:hypothetical protein IMCC3317_16620 [Kordia antarctica]|uniref:DUF2589 domain-containing protein n=1 Tax=Kordia antarctica TaxID=1218801 RepID=A0A7L4ZI35_9FLAO|nr:DUF2589 domain-containing protein [Kordia antarctica]QHI36302.1 hypothetical protein IMCC3317_16620 [Kordia antarctica]